MSDNLKRAAAERAAQLVTDGMRLGLGTGSTAAHFVAAIGERVRGGFLEGEAVHAVVTGRVRGEIFRFARFAMAFKVRRRRAAHHRRKTHEARLRAHG